jgi:radical SAM protein with 4Fe4S-binding SPASM domain
VRKGAKFETVIENIKELIRQKKSLGKSHPSVGIVVVLMNINGRELTKIMNFVYQLGVNLLLIKGLNTTYFEPSKLRYAGNEFEEAFSLSEEFKSKGFDIQFSFPHKDNKPRCHWPWMAAFVTVNGDITPCCNCLDPMTLSFGNIFRQPFLEIWNNQRYRDFRTTLRKEIPPLCRSCPDYSFNYLREQSMISPVFDEHNEISCLEFTDANLIYKRGESITINLSDISRSIPSEPVDLWVAIRMPNSQHAFLVNNPSELLFSSSPQPFKKGLKRTEKTHQIFASMKISEESMKGEYVFYAIYHKEKTDLSDLQKNLRSNIAKQTVTLL